MQIPLLSLPILDSVVCFFNYMFANVSLFRNIQFYRFMLEGLSLTLPLHCFVLQLCWNSRKCDNSNDVSSVSIDLAGSWYNLEFFMNWLQESLCMHAHVYERIELIVDHPGHCSCNQKDTALESHEILLFHSFTYLFTKKNPQNP